MFDPYMQGRIRSFWTLGGTLSALLSVPMIKPPASARAINHLFKFLSVMVVSPVVCGIALQSTRFEDASR
jgi:hypothetical protein